MRSGERQYAEVLVNGKTGTRQIPLIDSVPYVKDWIESHPQKNNSSALLFCTFRSGRPVSSRFVHNMYANYKKNFFIKLLESSIPNEDKNKIKELLNKPWNPYIRRHSALTEKSRILKEHVLRQYAGWSPNSMMHQRYLHYFGNETTNSLLEAYGILSRNGIELNKLKPTQCPNCFEANIIDSKFCSKCKMVLKYDHYLDMLEDEKKKADEIEDIKRQMEMMRQGQFELFELLGHQKELFKILENE